MKLEELPFGSPFIYDGRVYYKMFPTSDSDNNWGYRCYPVLQGLLQTPMVFFYRDQPVQLYVHSNI